MEEFKEFQGKDLDSAIHTACTYFNCEREKLEIEIISDAKSGIFGIVGVKKARIRARKIQLNSVKNIIGDISSSQSDLHNTKDTYHKGINKKSVNKIINYKFDDTEDNLNYLKSKNIISPIQDDSFSSSQFDQLLIDDIADDEINNEHQALSNLQIDMDTICEHTKNTINNLIRNIVTKLPTLNISIAGSKIYVKFDCGEESGILIGRDGQTLSSIQYLAARIISRLTNAAVHIHLDIGNYRQHQDEKLREMAMSIARRVSISGRSFSTRPLSSYHRRIIHITLQNFQDVQTRSVGEGALKRVTIMKKRFDKKAPQE